MTMTPNEKAQAYHDQLLPDHVSKLAQTDPELIRTFDNFAFDEVVAQSNLDMRTRLMVQLAAIMATQALNEFRIILGAALNVGVTPVEAKEIVYHGVPYLGMARVYDFLNVTNEVLVERGIDLPLPPQSTTTPETRMQMGKEVQGQVIGDDKVQSLYANSPDDLLHIQRFLSANCFGDNFTRKAIDLRTRELLTFTILVAQGGCNAQAKSHATANLHVGNDRAVLIDVLTQILPFIGYPRTLNGVNALNEAAPPVEKTSA